VRGGGSISAGGQNERTGRAQGVRWLYTSEISMRQLRVKKWNGPLDTVGFKKMFLSFSKFVLRFLFNGSSADLI
jgi:hypothetical protein